MDDGFLAVIAKPYVLKRYASVDFANRNGGEGLGRFLCLVEEREDAFCRRGHRLQHVRYLRQLRDRLRKALDILDIGYDITDRDRSLRREHCARYGDGNVSEVRHKVHHRHHETGQKLTLPAGGVELFVDDPEVLKLLLFTVEGFDDVVTREGLFDLTVDLSERLLLGEKVLLRDLHHDRDERNGDRQDHQRDERHERGDREHHHERADQRAHGCDQLCDALVQRLTQRIDVVGDAREHVAGLVGFKVSERHAVDLFADVAAHPVAHFLGNTAHDPALRKGKRRAERVKRHQTKEDRADPSKIDAALTGELFHETGKELRRGVAEDLRPDDGKNRGADGKDDHRDQTDAVCAHIANELSDGALKIFRLFNRSAGAASLSSSGSHQASPPFPVPSSSASESWLSAISR